MDARQFIIQFHAVLQGQKMVMKQLSGMEQQISQLGATSNSSGVFLDQYGRTVENTGNLSDKSSGQIRKFGNVATDTGKKTKIAGKQTKTLGENFAFISKRALLTIPVWIALRTAIMGIIRVIGNAITAQLDLEEGLARLRTVTLGTASEIESGMEKSRKAIINMAAQTDRSFSDLAEAMYFLRTANLNTEESLAAFPHAMNVIVATGADVKNVIRAMAGTWNTMKHTLEDATSASEGFQEIADMLTYTFATQDVEMKELTQSFSQFAPFSRGLGESFTEMVTTLGFLNTQMLRAGRTGRLTGRALLQLTQNSDKLAEIFGITFDPDAPIKFLDVIQQISNTMGENERITGRQADALREVFQMRGMVAVSLLIGKMDELNEAIAMAEKYGDNFAEKLKEIRMETVRAQWKRFNNILASVTNEFIHQVSAGESVATIMADINDGLDNSIDSAGEAGKAFRRMLVTLDEFDKMIIEDREWALGPQLGDRADGIAAIFEHIKARIFPHLTLKKIFSDENVISVSRKIGSIVGLTQLWDKNQERVNKRMKEQNIELKKQKEEKEKILGIATNLEVTEENRMAIQGLEEKTLETHLSLLESKGATNLEIAKAQEDYVKNLAKEGRIADNGIAQATARHDVLKAQYEMQKELKENILSDQINLLKAQGHTELEILDAKMRQLKLESNSINHNNTILSLANLRRQREIEIAHIQKQQHDTIKEIALEWHQAYDDEGRREELERIIKLLDMQPDELVHAARRSDATWKDILNNLSYFNQEQQAALREMAVERIPGGEILMRRMQKETKSIEQVLKEVFTDQDLASLLPHLFSKELKEQGDLALQELFGPQQVERARKFFKTIFQEFHATTPILESQWQKSMENQMDKYRQTHIEHQANLNFEDELRINVSLGLDWEPFEKFGKEMTEKIIDEGFNELANKLADNSEFRERLMKNSNIK